MKKNEICQIRDIYRAISTFEDKFSEKFDLSFNEAMLLCTLSKKESMTSGDIAVALDVAPSLASRIIRQLESLGYLHRTLGIEDHRQMNFSITESGTAKLQAMKCGQCEIPDALKNLLVG